MKDLSLFFSDLDREPCKSLFFGSDYVWDPLKNLDSLLKSILQNKTGVSLDGCLDKNEKGLFVQKWMKLDEAVCLKDLEIFIGAGTRLEPSAIIKISEGPATISIPTRPNT